MDHELSAEETRFFRIRGKDADRTDHSKRAWEKHQVGVWYGAWLPEELNEAIKRCQERDKGAALEYMNNTLGQQELGWKYTPSFFDTCRRFKGITEKEDWVVVYFEDTLYLGQLCGDIQIQNDHELNKKCEPLSFPARNQPKAFSTNRIARLVSVTCTSRSRQCAST